MATATLETETLAEMNPHVLSQEDRDAVERGRRDYAEGRWIDHDEFMAKLDQWFAEKEKN
jgi:predicted transcriptional regulator